MHVSLCQVFVFFRIFTSSDTLLAAESRRQLDPQLLKDDHFRKEGTLPWDLGGWIPEVSDNVKTVVPIQQYMQGPTYPYRLSLHCHSGMAMERRRERQREGETFMSGAYAHQFSLGAACYQKVTHLWRLSWVFWYEKLTKQHCPMEAAQPLAQQVLPWTARIRKRSTLGPPSALTWNLKDQQFWPL